MIVNEERLLPNPPVAAGLTFHFWRAKSFCRKD